MSTKSLTPNNGDKLNKNTLNSEMGVSSRSSINPSSKNVKKSKGAKQQVEAIEKLSKNVLPRKRVDLDAISKALVIALTAGATVITPAVVYFKRNEEYEVTMIADASIAFSAPSLTVKRGTIISVLKSQVANAVEGHTLIGLYKDQACTIPFADSDKITKNTQVFLKYEANKYEITLPEETDRFAIINSDSVDLKNIEWGNSFSFVLSAKGMYTQEDFIVMANGEVVEGNELGVYTIPFVDKDTRIEVLNALDFTYDLTLPTNVVLTKLGMEVTSVKYGDVVTLNYTEDSGKVMSTFTLDGNAIENGYTFKVDGSLDERIKFEQVDACGLSFVAGEESTTITGFDKTCSNVIIPSKVYNKTITSIPAELFEGSSVVENVTIPNTITEIGAEAFNGCVKLGNITFEDGSELTTIKAGAFKNTAITSITLPNILTSLEENAFEGCSQLTTVSLPSGITTITAGMFKDSGLTEIEIPSSVTTVEDGAFEGSDLQTITFATRTEALSIGKAAFKECLSLESITLPALTSLSDELFAQSGLKSIEIPSSVTTIGASVFEGCNSLTEITNLDKVTSIGAKTFKECLSLKSISLPALTSLSDELFAQSGIESIKIPSGVKTIGNSVFSGCEELETINLPNSITSYGSEVLTGTTKLKRIKLAKTDSQTGKINLSILTAANYQFENSSNYIFDVLQDSVLLSEYVVPEDVTIIQDETFKNSSFESIVLPEGLKTIGASVFEGCENLQMVNIPSTVTSIGSAAFKDCVSLESINLPAKLTAISDSLFSGSGLKSIEIPSTVKTIGENAFNGLSIQSITIPSSVTTIKDGAFDGCSALIDVTILSGSVVENITELSSCGNLILNAKTIKVSPVVQSSSSYLTNSCYKFVSKVGEIDFYLYAHKEASGETSYTVPKEVTTISSYTFLNSDLQSINFEEGSLLTTIKEYAFSSAKISSIEIPEKVTSIENGAFIGCGNLKNVTILSSSVVEQIIDLNSCGDLIANAIEVVVNKGDTNTYFDSTNYVQFESEKNDFFVRVGDRIDEEINYTQYVKFNNATYLGTETNQLHTLLYFNDISATGFEVPETTEIIVKDAFSGCSMLAEIDFSEARMLRKIGEGAFRKTALEEVYLPSTLKVLGDYAFADCKNLDVLVLEENVEVINPNIISGTYCELKVAKSAVSNQGYTINNNFAETYVFENENYYLHYQKTTGNNYNVPADVTIIPASTFENASYDEVVLPEGLKTIAKNAFKNSEIVRLTIPSSVTTIEEGAFNNCSYLEEVIFNGNSTAQKVMVRSLSKLSSSVSLTIGVNAFSNCEILKKITFSNNITHIGDNAFQGCSKLTDVVLPEELLSIGKQAFADCVGLTNITIPAKVETISTKAFYGCVNLETVTINSETIYSNIHYLSDCGNLLTNAKEININQSFSGNEYFENKGNFIKIPNGEYFAYVYVDGNIDENSEVEYTQLVTENNATYLGTAENAYHTLLYIDDKTVTSAEINSSTEMIAGNAFAESLVESIIIPKFVKEIRENAFYNSKLKTITFEEESVLQVIGEKSFANTEINAIEIPETVESINSGAFMNTDLTQIRIPKSVVSIGERAFVRTNLEEVIIESEAIYQAANGVNETIVGGLLNEIARVQVVRGEDWGEVTNSYLKSRSFSKLTAENKEYFFADFNEEIIIPSDVTTIPGEAFKGRTNLQRINFANSEVVRIEDGAFAESGLVEIFIPKTVTYLGLHAFENCASLTSVEFDEEIQPLNMKSYLFAGTTLLKSINIPSSAISINDYCFLGSALETITFGSEESPAQLTYIGREAFVGTNLQSIIIPATVDTLVNTAFSGLSSLKEVKFEKGSVLKSLGVELFKGLPIENITIPASVETIQNFAFGSCTQLKTINFEEGSHLKEIHANAFNGCSTLEQINIPASVEEIGSSVFEGCSSLANITLAEGNLTKIYANAFKGSAITSLHIPSNVTTLYKGAFDGCESLATITFADGAKVSVFTANLFSQTAITSIRIPANVTTIDSTAFSGRSLTSVTFEKGSKLGAISSNLFAGMPIASIEIPSSVITISNNAFGGCANLTEVTFEDGSLLTNMYGYSFTNCSALTTITIPKGVKDLGAAFGGCTALESVYFEEGSILETIATNAFSGCSNLKEIILPDSVRIIYSGAFSGCSSLEEIELSDSLTTIGANAFNGCAITSVVIPENVKTIGEGAFTSLTSVTIKSEDVYSKLANGGLSGWLSDTVEVHVVIEDGTTTINPSMFAENQLLKSVTIPASVTEIGELAFQRCENLVSVTFEVNNKLTTIGSEAFSGCSSLTSITIPTTVTSIYDNAFGYTGLTSIELPAGVTVISDSMFYECKALESVTFLGDVTTIGNSAFSGCSSLTNINLPDSVTSIGANAFEGTAITEITLPASLETIGSGAFGWCSNLTTVTFEENSKLTSIGEGAFNNSGITSIEIPASVTSIGANAFEGTAITEITLPASLETIGANAFNGCAITSVVIPENVKTIGEGAFTNLTSVTIKSPTIYSQLKDGIHDNWIGEAEVHVVIKDGTTAIEDDAFVNCTSLKSIEIVEGVETIETQAFAGCTGLTEIEIPSSVISIRSVAFSGCSNLETINFRDIENSQLTAIGDEAFGGTLITSIVLPDSVTSLGSKSFVNCRSLTSIELSESLTSIGESAFQGTAITEISLPASLTTIGANAFNGCAITSVVIPENVKIIGEGAFTNLTSATIKSPTIYSQLKDGTHDSWIGEAEVYLVIKEGTTSIAKDAFINCDNIVSVTLPTTLQSIGHSAFKGCANLQSIEIPASVTLISNYAFADCSSLESVAFEKDNQLANIYGYAFYGCSSLEEITIPAGVKEIGGSLFEGCSNLTSVILEEENSQLTNIYANAFKGTKITSLHIPANVTTLYKGAFNGCESLATITFADGSKVSGFTTNLFLQTAITSIRIPASVTTIDSTAFSERSLTSVTFEKGSKLETISSNLFAGMPIASIEIPSSVKTISNNAFDGCGNLSSVTFEEESKLTDIYGEAFINCVDLDEIEIPANVERIGASVFEGCESLQSITFENGSQLSIISKDAFKGTAITSIEIPENVTFMENVFTDCDQLTSVTIASSYVYSYATSKETFGGLLKNANEIYIINAAFEKAQTNPNEYLTNNYVGIHTNSSIYYYPATEIFAEAFKERLDITKVTIPESVTTIGNSAFAACSNLESVEFVGIGQLTTIGELAFWNCSSLTSIEIPASVETISTLAFHGCSSLSSLTFAIESKLIKIDNEAFSDCVKLTSIELPASATTIGEHAFGRSGLTSLYIPAGVTVISGEMFTECKDLEFVTIAGNVTEIGDYAFYGCESLRDMDIPASVTSIGENAFTGCSSLIDVTIRSDEIYNELTSLDSCGGLIANATDIYLVGDAFTEAQTNPNEYLTNNYVGIHTNSSIYYYPATEISAEAFKERLDITKVTIPASVKTIEKDAFNGCEMLEAVYFADESQLETIGDNAFANCSLLSEISLPEGVIEIGASAFNVCSTITSLTLPNSLQTIGDSALGGTGLTSLYIPKNVTSIGSAAFEINSLESITFDDEINLSTISSGMLQGTKISTITIPESVTTIESLAFGACLNLTSITIPENVTTIDEAAFYECNLTSVTIKSPTIYSQLKNGTHNSWIGNAEVHVVIKDGTITIQDEMFGSMGGNVATNLVSVSIPASVETIGYLAFGDCSNLTTVTFRDAGNSQLTSIGANAFYCSGITSIEIPASVETIESNAFLGCSNLTTVEFVGESKLETIKNAAFAHSGITSIEIPASVEAIYALAFVDCKSLESVTFEEGSQLITIGSEAFSGCSSLTNINLPSTVTSIYNNAFGHTGLTSIELPAGVTFISGDMFYECKDLESVTFLGDVITIGEGAFYDCESLTSINLPDSVISIGANAFKDAAITEITLPASLETIGAGAFSGCAITSVVIPENVKTIGEGAFTNLTSATIKSEDIYSNFLVEGGEYVDWLRGAEVHVVIEDGTTTINPSMFAENQLLKSVTIPASVETIEYNAFVGCGNLTTVEFVGESKLQTIGCGAFANSGITSIEIPASVTEIGDLAFQRCENLGSVTFDENSKLTTIGGEAFAWCEDLTSIEIPASVTLLGIQAFGRTGLTSIEIPSGVTVINADMFYECKDLESVTFLGDVTTIGNSAFYACSSLTSTNLPDSVISIGEDAFKDAAITEITLPASLETIGSGAFSGCAITEVVIPENVKTIGEGAFTSLTSVTIKSEDVYSKLANGGLSGWLSDTAEVHVVIEDGTTIANDLFESCSQLKSVSIPASVEEIGSSAFCRCVNLTTVEFVGESKLQTIGYAAFANSGITSIKIPANVTEIGELAFQTCENLASVTFEVNNKLTTIGAEAFNHCSSLTSITIPSTVTSIGASAFLGSGLTSIELPAGVTVISDSMFYECKDLESVTLLGDVTTIGNSAFYGCSSLTNIELPASVNSIGESAFANSGLTSIALPDNLITIGENAFTNLTSVTIANAEMYDHLTSIDSYGGLIASATEIHIVDAAFNYALKNSNDYLEANYIKVVKTDVISYYKATQIDDNEFNGNTDITSVSIPASVTSIGANAFNGCSNLENVKLADNGQSLTIGANAFANTAITEMFIPQNVTSIGDLAFGGCDITTVDIASTTVYNSIDSEYACGGLIANATDIQATNIGENSYLKTKYIGVISGSNVHYYPAIEIIDGQFAHRSDINKVTIPESVTSIGERAFEDCANLTTVEFVGESSLQTIGDMAFNSCSNLTSIEIPASVETIGALAFVGCKNLESVTFDKNDGQLTMIGNEAFSGCESLTNINIPTTVTSIGASAFLGSGLTSINIPGSVTEISDDMFYECKDLEYVGIIFGDTSKIGDRAFYGCEKLTSIYIPASVTSIGEDAFTGCSSLTSVTIASDEIYNGLTEEAYGGLIANATEIYVEGAAFEASRDNRLACLQDKYVGIFIEDQIYYYLATEISDAQFAGRTEIIEVTLPNSVTKIGNSAFDTTSLTSITLSSGLETIGNMAFAGCEITSVAIPASVTSIGAYAFTGCSSLTSVTIASGEIYAKLISSDSCGGLIANATDIYLVGDAFTEAQTNPNEYFTNNFVGIYTDSSIYYYQATEISAEAFKERLDITKVTIPASVKTIEKDAFNGCEMLEAVYFADRSQLETIGEGAFYGCSSLTSINLPEGVTEIGARALNGCSAITSLTLPNSLQTIGDSALGGTGLTSIAIPESVTTIGSNAFDFCESLAEIEFLGTSQLKTLSSGVFVGTKISTITIPESVTTIESHAFGACLNLTSITIPENVTTIDGMAFFDCNLTSVTIKSPTIYSELKEGKHDSWIGNAEVHVVIKDGTTTIQDEMFGSMGGNVATNLVSVSIPASVEIIGNLAFSWCSNLTTVTFAENSQLTSIGDYAFQNSGITSIEIPASVESIYALAFVDCKSLESVTFEEGSQLTSIGGEAFNGCSSLTNINLPSTVIWIYDNAFGYTGLTSIELPAGVTVISDYMFCECKDLESVTFLGDVITIGERAFQNCEKLTNINLPDSVTSIGANAFEGTAITEITLPASLETIGANAFNGCAITSVVIPENVTYVGENAFTNLTSVTIKSPTIYSQLASGTHNSWIGNAAVHVVIQDGTEYIDNDIFMNYKKLKSVTIPASITTIGENAFFGCSNLETVTFEEGSSLTEICASAFYNCSSLTSFDFTNIQHIGNNAFEGCSSLAMDLILTGKVVGNSAFKNSGITNVSYRYYDSENIEANAFEGTAVTNLEIPFAPAGGFKNCKSLTSVKISIGGDNLHVVIGAGAFEGCENLTSLDLPDEFNGQDGYNGQTYEIQESAFKDCTSLTRLYLADTCTYISATAFVGSGLENVYVPTESYSYNDGVYDKTEEEVAYIDALHNYYNSNNIYLVKGNSSIACVETYMVSGCSVGGSSDLKDLYGYNNYSKNIAKALTSGEYSIR